MKKSSRVKKSYEDQIFDILNYVLLTLVVIVIIVPLWNIVALSFSSSQAIAKGSTVFWPAEFSLENYRAVLQDSSMLSAFGISVARTVIGIVLHVLVCAVMAYGLSKPFLKGRKFYMTIGVITMLFSGGMVPTYLLFKKLGLLNSFLVYIVPNLLSYYDVIVIMTYYKSLPESLEDAAKIDGAGEWTALFKVILPLSKPVLATIALFHGVWQWNDFMSSKLYITNESLYPLQMKIYDIIVQQQAVSLTNPTSVVIETSTRGVQMATIVITTVPILIIYPLLQKYFVTGITRGAVKA